MEIKSKNLALRPYRKSDEDDLVENINDKLVSRYMCRVPYPYAKKDAREWHKRYLENKKKNKTVSFAIEVEGRLAGIITLEKIKGHKAELGYWLGRRHWSKGIMTKVVKMMANFGFKKLKLKRIYAHVFPKNKMSARVLEKNGFRKEGLLRKDRIKDGKFIDMYIYAKVK